MTQLEISGGFLLTDIILLITSGVSNWEEQKYLGNNIGLLFAVIVALSSGKLLWFVAARFLAEIVRIPEYLTNGLSLFDLEHHWAYETLKEPVILSGLVICGAILYAKIYFRQKSIFTPKNEFLRQKKLFLRQKTIFTPKKYFYAKKIFLRQKNYFYAKKLFLRQKNYFSAKKLFYRNLLKFS